MIDTQPTPEETPAAPLPESAPPDQAPAKPSAPPAWAEHWKGMPEFQQEKQRPYAQLTVRFENQEDLDDFCRRIEQRVTPKTKSIWHPFKSHFGEGPTTKTWVDEGSVPK